MQVASKTRQIGFLCYHDHTVGRVHSSGYSLFVKWSKWAQIYHFDRAAIAMNTIGSSRSGLQHHPAPTNDSEADWPIAVGLIRDAGSHANGLRCRLVIVYKLNFRAACLSIYHARTCDNANNHLFVEWAADGASWKLRDQRRGCAEYTTFGATYILPIDEKARITPGQFYQCLVNCAQHWQLLSGPSWDILLPFGNMYDVLQATFRRGFRLLYNLGLGAFQLRPDFPADTLYIAFLEITVRDKPATKVFNRVFGGCCCLNLLLRAVGFNIGAAGMRIEQTQAQVHQHRALTSAHIFNKAPTGFIVRHGVSAINLFGINACALCPVNQRSAPLDGRGSSNGPSVVLDHHQHRQLVHRYLAKERIEVVGCYSTVAGGEHDDVLAFVLLQGETNPTCKRS